MRNSIVTLSLSLGLALTSACAGGISGGFKGNGASARPVAASDVKTVANKAAMTGTYNELGIARGSAPTAQQAVDQAKIHCGQHGGTHVIMNTEPFLSGNSYKVDATCATTQPLNQR
jgi:hypothetical protein